MKTIMGIVILTFSPYMGIFLVIVASTVKWVYGNIPWFLAIPCGIWGSMIIYIRYSAWKDEIAQSGLASLEAYPKAYVKSMNIELLYWGAGLSNILIFIRWIV